MFLAHQQSFGAKNGLFFSLNLASKDLLLKEASLGFLFPSIFMSVLDSYKWKVLNIVEEINKPLTLWPVFLKLCCCNYNLNEMAVIVIHKILYNPVWHCSENIVIFVILTSDVH